MNTDLQSLYKVVDQLSEQERAQLMNYLAGGTDRPTLDDAQPKNRGWTFDLAPGAIQTTPDFDDPLPDSFWLGEE